MEGLDAHRLLLGGQADVRGAQRGRGGWNRPGEREMLEQRCEKKPCRRQQEAHTYQLCLRRKSSRCGPLRPSGSSGIMKWSSTNVNWSNLSVTELRLATASPGSQVVLVSLPPPTILWLKEPEAC